MKKILFLAGIICCFAFFNLSIASAGEVEENFQQWLRQFKTMANTEYGISQELLKNAFEGVEYNHKIVELDMKQPEFVKTFWDYFNSSITRRRIDKGRELMRENMKLLRKIQAKYGVQPQILVALWAIESDYGKNMGRVKIIPALATLAFHPRRSSFFTNELISALKIIAAGHVALEDMKGSHMGAFGNFQFIPSTFLSYAVDGDGDGKKDLFNSKEDALTSAANYLQKIGWKRGYIWGRAVKYDKNNARLQQEFNSKEWKDLSYFARLGVKTYSGKPLPKVNVKARLVAPMLTDGPVFLVYENFERLLHWNKSTNYSLMVGILADRIASDKYDVFGE